MSAPPDHCPAGLCVPRSLALPPADTLGTVLIEIGATQAKRVFTIHEEEIALPQLLATHVARSCSFPDPSAISRNMWSPLACRAVWAQAICFPSGDQTGANAVSPLKLARECTLRLRS